MIGSTTPVAEQANWHPVHRANAMLRAALLSSTCSPEPSADAHDAESLSRAIESVLRGPVRITFPQSLAERLDALAIKEDAFPAFEALVEKRRGPALPASVDVSQGAELETWGDGDDNLGKAGTLTVGAPLDSELRALPPQIHVQSLLHEFHRRQRRASLLVAGSIATAVLLTVGGIWLIANLTPPHPVGSDNRPLLRSTSVAWQRPVVANATAGLPLASVSTNRAAKGEPLLVPAPTGAQAASAKGPSSHAQIILAASRREVAFAPLLPPSHAGYFLIRGLPSAAKFSIGRKSDSGTWLVKAEQAHALTLAIGDVAEGDYPVEIYVLRSGDAPQGRRSLVLRVEGSPHTYAASGPDKSWTATLLDVVPAARAAEAPAVPVELAVLRERAERLLDEGDIAAARLVLLYLAEQGEGEAAYELARTFDGEMLAELGVRGVAEDLVHARAWYERASQSGNEKATERLKILASLSGAGPSD